MQESQEMWARFLRWEDPLEKEMATHSSILAWEILWTEEPGRLHSMGSQTHLSMHNSLNFSLRCYRPFSLRVLRELYRLYLVVLLSAFTITKHHKWSVFHSFRVLVQGWVLLALFIGSDINSLILMGLWAKLRNAPIKKLQGHSVLWMVPFFISFYFGLVV